ARLTLWNNRLAYALGPDEGTRWQPRLLIEAASGRRLSPISRPDAESVARTVGGSARIADVDLLEEGDHYLLSNEYRFGFPAWVVHFDDANATGVYVSRAGGNVVGVVTTRTRWTTWL